MSDDYHGLPTPRTTLRDKRRRRRTTAAALAGLLTALPAVSSARDVAILAPPNNSCGSWVSHRRAPRPMLAQYEQWVLGFVSGIAVTQMSTDFLKGLDPAAVYGWLDNYCRAHPLEPLPNALQDLAQERGAH